MDTIYTSITHSLLSTQCKLPFVSNEQCFLSNYKHISIFHCYIDATSLIGM